jgi:hypothetical protein
MELIERYLQAVKFWLPARQKDDIIAELSEDLHAQIEERESALGHKLSEAEVEAILMRRGRPVLVANRFLPQEQLIGPVLFPIYRFVLKIVMLCYLVPWGLTWLGMMIYSPAFRAAHSGHSWIEAAGSLWSALWSTAFLAVGTVTIVFAVLERVEAKTHFLEKWDPRKLPAVRHPNVIPRSGSVIEVAANLVFILWWATNMYSPIAMIRPDVQISVSPLWPWFFWSLLLSASGNVALAAVNLTRPYWTGGRASLRLIADCIGSAVFCWLLKANVLTGIVVANVPTERTLHLTETLNTLMVKAFPVSVVVCVVIAGADTYRIVRLLKTARLRLTSGSAMIAA